MISKATSTSITVQLFEQSSAISFYLSSTISVGFIAAFYWITSPSLHQIYQSRNEIGTFIFPFIEKVVKNVSSSAELSLRGSLHPCLLILYSPSFLSNSMKSKLLYGFVCWLKQNSERPVESLMSVIAFVRRVDHSKTSTGRAFDRFRNFWITLTWRYFIGPYSQFVEKGVQKPLGKTWSYTSQGD